VKQLEITCRRNDFVEAGKVFGSSFLCTKGVEVKDKERELKSTGQSVRTFHCLCSKKDDITFQLRHHKVKDRDMDGDGDLYRFHCYATAVSADRISRHFGLVKTTLPREAL
jgi:hypothetical protein